jgi:hypothetical protein
MTWDFLSMSHRGVAMATACFGGLQANSNMGEEDQAPYMPVVSVISNPQCSSGNIGGYLRVNNSVVDTSTSPLVALLLNPTGKGFQGPLEISGGTWGPITGAPFASSRFTEDPGACSNQFVEAMPGAICGDDGSLNEIHNTMTQIFGPNPQTTGIQTGISLGTLLPPNAPTASASTTCPSPNGYPSGTGYYNVIWIDYTGGITSFSPASGNITLNGSTQCGYITQPTPVPVGAYCWAVYAYGFTSSTGGVANRQGSTTYCPLSSWGSGAWNLATTTAIDQTSFKNGNISGTASTAGLHKLTQNGFYGTTITGQEQTETQCFSSASPAVCGNNINGFVAIASGSSSVVVDTTLVTANSEISLTFDATQGTNLGVTCNTTAQQPYISARTAGTSFTISVPTNFSTNPGCIGFHIKN